MRHGQSEWNLAERFTGLSDVDLTPKGVDEAKQAGTALNQHDIKIDIAYTSLLKRAQKTLSHILNVGQFDVETVFNAALNERDFGDLTGLGHKQTIDKFGEEQVRIWRSAYDVPPPNGESLKDTYNRTIPYFEKHILPQYMNGENVIIVSHNITLKALIMYLEQKPANEIEQLNLTNGQPMVYQYSENWVNADLS